MKFLLLVGMIAAGFFAVLSVLSGAALEFFAAVSLLMGLFLLHMVVDRGMTDRTIVLSATGFVGLFVVLQILARC